MIAQINIRIWRGVARPGEMLRPYKGEDQKKLP